MGEGLLQSKEDGGQGWVQQLLLAGKGLLALKLAQPGTDAVTQVSYQPQSGQSQFMSPDFEC